MERNRGGKICLLIVEPANLADLKIHLLLEAGYQLVSRGGTVSQGGRVRARSEILGPNLRSVDFGVELPQDPSRVVIIVPGVVVNVLLSLLAVLVQVFKVQTRLVSTSQVLGLNLRFIDFGVEMRGES